MASEQQLKAANQQLRASEEETRALAKFPSENPNPVLRISEDCTILYANDASSPVLETWGRRAGERLPDDCCKRVEEVFSSAGVSSFEFKCHNGRIFSVIFAPVVSEDYINVYGLDITERNKAEEQIESLAKFPSENPNPVLRVAKNGEVLYSNDAGLQILSKWKSGVHKAVPDRWQHLITEVLKSGKSRSQEEEEVSGKIFSFVISPVINAGYVNLYSRNITERKKAEKKLLEYQAQLKSLASELSLTEERERRRIATNLHDNISQVLALSKINLQTLGKSEGLTNNSTFNEISESIKSTIEQVQSLIFDLSSPILYKFGLEKAVDELLQDQLQKMGIIYELTDDKSSKPLDEDIMVLLFQSVRELLINIIKHAQARKVVVAIQRDGDSIRITVSDDGVGFDVDQVESFTHRTGGFGLFNIRERLDYIGGSFEIQSQPGGGSWFTLIAPLKTETDLAKEKPDGTKNSTG